MLMLDVGKVLYLESYLKEEHNTFVQIYGAPQCIIDLKDLLLLKEDGYPSGTQSIYLAKKCYPDLRRKMRITVWDYYSFNM